MSKRRVRSYSGLWDCRKCNTIGMTNDQKHCTNCGASIPMLADGTPDTYPPKDKERYAIRDAERLGRIERQEGVWECRFCGSVMLDEELYCEDCGASKEGVEYDPAKYGETESKSLRVPESSQLPEIKSTPSISSMYSPPESRMPESRYEAPVNNRLRNIAIVAVLLVMIAGFVFYATRTTDKVVTVQGFRWERSITIEHLVWVDESSQSGFPSGSRNGYTRIEEVGSTYQQVGTTMQDVSEPTGENICSVDTVKNPDGSYSDMENCVPEYKTVSKEVPVYDWVPVMGTVYYYEIQEWQHARNIETSGNNRTPYWGEVVLALLPDPEREVSGRHESYFVDFVDVEEHVFTMQMPYHEWVEFNSNIPYMITINNLRFIVDLQPAG